MADSLFGLSDLSDKLNASVGASLTPTASDPYSNPLAEKVGGDVQNWLQTSIFPLIIGAVIFVTVLAVFYGGFLYFTAYGDENKAMTAKKSITYGFIGLFIALVAFTITSYVRQNIVSTEAEKKIFEPYTAPVTQEGTTSNGLDILNGP